MKSNLADEVCADAALSSIAYANLVVFVAILFCFSGLGVNAAMLYVAFASFLFWLTAMLGRYAKSQASIYFKFAAMQSIIFFNELALVSVLAFDIFSLDRVNSVNAAAIIISASFISVHLCARHTLALFVSKLFVVSACVIFLINHATTVLSNSAVIASLTVAYLITVAVGYWVIVRRRQELFLQVQLQKMKATAEDQNRKLVKVLEEKEFSQRQFLDESQLRKKLITHIGHDLRQPISAAMYMLMELKKKQEGSEQTVLVEDTQECIHSAGRMIENIVQYSHFDNLTIDVKPRQINLNEVLQSLNREYVSTAKQAHCRMRCVATSVVIQFDYELLKRILRNLIINAINHSDATKLLLGVRRTEKGIEVWVLDNGCGLVVGENKPDSTVKLLASSGLGLGMKISKQLAESCGATLSFSTQQGEGTLCRLAIPRSCVVYSEHDSQSRLAKEKNICA